MTRAKVKLAYITNDAARKAALKKRKKGLMKKMSELTTLCGIEACAIVFGPGDSRPDVWPNSNGARDVVYKYQVVPELIQTKKKLNQESFMKQRIEKATEQLKKMRMENSEKAMRLAMVECVGGMGMQNMSMTNLNDMAWMIQKNLKDINKKMEAMDKELVAAKEEVYVPEPAAASDGQNQSTSELEMDRKQQLWNEMLHSHDPPFGDINQHNAFWPHIMS